MHRKPILAIFLKKEGRIIQGMLRVSVALVGVMKDYLSIQHNRRYNQQIVNPSGCVPKERGTNAGWWMTS